VTEVSFYDTDVAGEQRHDLQIELEVHPADVVEK
jgi:hypothetical protein